MSVSWLAVQSRLLFEVTFPFYVTSLCIPPLLIFLPCLTTEFIHFSLFLFFFLPLSLSVFFSPLYFNLFLICYSIFLDDSWMLSFLYVYHKAYLSHSMFPLLTYMCWTTYRTTFIMAEKKNRKHRAIVEFSFFSSFFLKTPHTNSNMAATNGQLIQFCSCCVALFVIIICQSTTENELGMKFSANTNNETNFYAVVQYCVHWWNWTPIIISFTNNVCCAYFHCCIISFFFSCVGNICDIEPTKWLARLKCG